MSIRDQVERVYEAEREHIYSYLRYFGVPPQRAQELAQDCFVKLHIRMSKGETIDDPRAWLYRVAQNQARRFHRREPVFDELDLNIGGPRTTSDPEQAAMQRQRQGLLEQAIRGLSPQQKNCLFLRGQGLRYREIAGAMGISSSAVGEFLRRAVEKLKEAVNG
ncbi:RNA polymerase sigma factor [uncultured Paludibaculum sp.]|uniref:RNA polymerase sigma factor n=1 Tax=uncultured Paludibaculum sp. TaxID=1765020 RepID=UPI002AAAB6EB|nr:RNA polymerase sigma factor [uncultured Paludibaculum sp.]